MSSESDSTEDWLGQRSLCAAAPEHVAGSGADDHQPCSSDEDWFSPVPTEGVASVVVAAMPILDRSDCDGPPAVQRSLALGRRGHRMQRVAAATIANDSEAALMVDDATKRCGELLFSGCTSDGNAHTHKLESAAASADALCMWQSGFRAKLRAVAEVGVTKAMEIVQIFIVGAIRTAASTRIGGGGAVRPSVFFRARMYDGTRMRNKVGAIKKEGDEMITSTSTAAHEIFVAMVGFGMLFRKVAHHGCKKMLLLHGTIPTTSQVHEGTSAEVLDLGLNMLTTFESDKHTDEAFPRQVDLVFSDGHKANIRRERKDSINHPNRRKILMLCRAHMKSKLAPIGYKRLNALDSKVIRLQLSVEGGDANNIQSEARQIHVEQLVIYMNSVCLADASRHPSPDRYFIGGRSGFNPISRCLHPDLQIFPPHTHLILLCWHVGRTALRPMRSHQSNIHILSRIADHSRRCRLVRLVLRLWLRP